MILPVNDVDASVEFYTSIVGCTYEGRQEPYAMVRVSDDFMLQLAQWPTEGNVHIAFALSRTDFDAAFARIRDAGIAYGPSFHNVGTMEGPGREAGARGDGPTVYVYDPSHHLVELRHYDD